MRKRLCVVLCILLIGVLGCSDVVRYEPGYHEVHEGDMSAEDIQNGDDRFQSEVSTSVVDIEDVPQDSVRH